MPSRFETSSSSLNLNLFFFSISPLKLYMFHQAIKPNVLIGSAGIGRSFTKEVIEAMSSINEVLVIHSSAK